MRVVRVSVRNCMSMKPPRRAWHSSIRVPTESLGVMISILHSQTLSPSCQRSYTECCASAAMNNASVRHTAQHIVAFISYGSADLQHCQTKFTAFICCDMSSLYCWLSQRLGSVMSPNIGLADVLPFGSIRQVAGVVHRDLLSVCQHTSVHHSGRSDDQIQVILTL